MLKSSDFCIVLEKVFPDAGLMQTKWLYNFFYGILIHYVSSFIQ